MHQHGVRVLDATSAHRITTTDRRPPQFAAILQEEEIMRVNTASSVAAMIAACLTRNSPFLEADPPKTERSRTFVVADDHGGKFSVVVSVITPSANRTDAY